MIQKARDIAEKQRVSASSSSSAKSVAMAFGSEAILPGYLKIELLSSQGFQECPFHKKEVLCHKGAFEHTIQNLKTEESIKVSQLVIALIGSHAFFEGNTAYRVDPEKLCRVLEINSRKYERVTEKIWKMCDGDSIEPGLEDAVKKYAEKSEDLNDHVTAYLLPFQDIEDYENRGLTKEQVIRKKGKASGKSEEEIQEKIDSTKKFNKLFGSPSDLSEVITSKKGTYCHVFIRETLSKPERFSFEGVPFPEAFRSEFHYVFEVSERTKVREIEESKSCLGKRKTAEK